MSDVQHFDLYGNNRKHAIGYPRPLLFRVKVLEFRPTFNKSSVISWRPGLLVEESVVP
jgi:hypothetical protein